MTRGELTLTEKSGDATNLVATRLEFELYRKSFLILEEVIINECYNSLYPPIFLTGDFFSEYIGINNRYYNSTSPFALNLIRVFDTVTYKNMHLEHVNPLSSFTVSTQNTRNIILDNVTMINNDLTGTFTEAVFYMTSIGGNTSVNDFKVIDSKLGYRSAFHFLPSGDSYLSITN